MVGVPSDKLARLFYRCAIERIREAKVLIKSDQKTAGAIYLAGYGVECILKALILNDTNPVDQGRVLQLFRGNKAHDFNWLKDLYLRSGGAQIPANMAIELSRVSSWSTAMRYVPRTYGINEIISFIRSVDAIMAWACGRL